MLRAFIRRIRMHRHFRQAFFFVTCGLLGATIEFVSLLIMVELLHITPHVAYIPSGLLAVTFVFFFNKHVTFAGRSAGSAKSQGMKFAMVYSVAFALNYALASTFYSIAIRLLPLGSIFHDKAYLVAKAGAIGIIAIINYLLSHGFIFKENSDHVEVVQIPL